MLQKNKVDVDALLQRARIYLASRKFEQAQTDLNQVLHYRSNSAEAHYLLAKADRGRGDSPLEQQELGEALKVDPTYVNARLELAQALIANRAAQSALQLLDQAPESQKGMAALVLQRNWALLSLGQTAEARQNVDRVLAAAKLPEALVQDAVLKFIKSDFAGARAAADQALSQSPEDTRALSVIAQAYAAQKQPAAALKAIRDHAARQPKSAPVQAFLGQMLASNGDPADARKAFEAAATANPGLTGPVLALAQIDANEGKRDDARKRLAALISAHPDSLSGQLLWAEVELQDGKNATALEHFRKALAQNENSPVALNGVAYLLADAGQPDEALKYAQKAKELAPADPSVDDTLGWTYFKKGLYPMAVTHLESATAREGTAVRKYHLAMAYLKAGDPARGRQTLEAALKLNPKLPEAQLAKQMFGDTGK